MYERKGIRMKEESETETQACSCVLSSRKKQKNRKSKSEVDITGIRDQRDKRIYSPRKGVMKT